MKKRGVTLIELLLVMMLLAVVLPAIVSVYIYGSKTFTEQLTQSRLQSDAQTLLDEITNDIRNAQSVEDVYGTYTTDSNTIILRVPALDSGQVIQYNGTSQKSDYIIYDFTGTSIHKVIYADPSSIRYPQNNQNKVIANNILMLTFSYDPSVDSATLVQVNVRNNQSVGKVVENFSVTSKARLRNHI